MDHKDIGIILFLLGLAGFLVWVVRALMLSRATVRPEPEPTDPASEPATSPAEGEAAPAEATPAKVAPAKAAPEPVEAAPAEAKPAEAEAEPAEAALAEAAPAEAKPAEAALAEAEPAEAEPAEAAPEPAKAEPAEAEPVEAAPEPAKAEPAEAAPVEAEPAEAAPAEAEPAKAAPAEAAPEAAKAAPAEPKPKPKPKPTKKQKKALKAGLAKTRRGFVARIGDLFRGKREIDASVMEELEEVLFTADIGVRTSEALFGKVKDALDRKALKDVDAVWTVIREEATRILTMDARPLRLEEHQPFVLLTVGVNGVGKTTTIGKLAAKFSDAGKRCLLAAGDTFRAAAVEQLEVWGQRVDAPVVKGKDGQDPSSVIFDAIKQASQDAYDVVICDTAGRLHTKVNLMEELQKIQRVSGKALDGAPHEVFLVLDATTGQNAIQQANLFKEVVDISGIVLTKLDGTAKGGIILGICDELQIPVRYIGIGEGVEDLREFDAGEFVNALFSPADQDEA